jgi:hypothetical protein
MERLQDALTDGDNMKHIFVFTTTLTLLLTLGFKAEAGWNIVSSPNADALDNVLLAQYAASSSDIWAVGYYHSANPGLQNQPLFIHWNGIAWSNVSMSQAFGINSDLFGIGGIASSDVWCGRFHPNGGQRPLGGARSALERDQLGPDQPSLYVDPRESAGDRRD